uniref:Ubiquitin-like domain-containing protein n=1 Tax=Heterorhabditis bacteriophora TaxID=37862 RepID=A0A1I7WL82_HETBA
MSGHISDAELDLALELSKITFEEEEKNRRNQEQGDLITFESPDEPRRRAQINQIKRLYSHPSLEGYNSSASSFLSTSTPASAHPSAFLLSPHQPLLNSSLSLHNLTNSCQSSFSVQVPPRILPKTYKCSPSSFPPVLNPCCKFFKCSWRHITCISLVIFGMYIYIYIHTYIYIYIYMCIIIVQSEQPPPLPPRLNRPEILRKQQDQLFDSDLGTLFFHSLGVFHISHFYIRFLIILLQSFLNIYRRFSLASNLYSVNTSAERESYDPQCYNSSKSNCHVNSELYVPYTMFSNRLLNGDLIDLGCLEERHCSRGTLDQIRREFDPLYRASEKETCVMPAIQTLHGIDRNKDNEIGIHIKHYIATIVCLYIFLQISFVKERGMKNCTSSSLFFKAPIVDYMTTLATSVKVVIVKDHSWPRSAQIEVAMTCDTVTSVDMLITQALTDLMSESELTSGVPVEKFGLKVFGLDEFLPKTSALGHNLYVGKCLLHGKDVKLEIGRYEPSSIRSLSPAPSWEKMKTQFKYSSVLDKEDVENMMVHLQSEMASYEVAFRSSSTLNISSSTNKVKQCVKMMCKLLNSIEPVNLHQHLQNYLTATTTDQLNSSRNDFIASLHNFISVYCQCTMSSYKINDLRPQVKEKREVLHCKEKLKVMVNSVHNLHEEWLRRVLDYSEFFVTVNVYYGTQMLAGHNKCISKAVKHDAFFPYIPMDVYKLYPWLFSCLKLVKFIILIINFLQVLASVSDWGYYFLSNVYQIIEDWAPLSPVQAMQLLLPRQIFIYPDVRIRQKAIEWISRASSDFLFNALPQLVEALRFEVFESSSLAVTLLTLSYKDRRFAFEIYWQLQQRIDHCIDFAYAQRCSLLQKELLERHEADHLRNEIARQHRLLNELDCIQIDLRREESEHTRLTLLRARLGTLDGELLHYNVFISREYICICITPILFFSDRVPFVFTDEMYHVINGGNQQKESYQTFIDYCCRAFNYLRRKYSILTNLLKIMACSDIAGVNIESLAFVENNLMLELSETDAVIQFTQLINHSLKSAFPRINFFFHTLAQVISSAGSTSRANENGLSFVPQLYTLVSWFIYFGIAGLTMSKFHIVLIDIFLEFI